MLAFIQSSWILSVTVILAGGFANTALAADMDGEIGRPIRAERNLVYRQVAGETLHADLFRPSDDAIYPLVIMIHGGAWSAGNKWHMQDHARELAQAGFVAVSINYRLAPKYPISCQIDDCRVALQWAIEQAQQWRADTSRILLWGYSAGGHLAAMLATNPQSDAPAIRGVVAGGAPCEFSFVPPQSTALSYVFEGTRAENPKAYQQASPLNFASSDACPFFFFHGSEDVIVPPSSSRQMHDKLRSLNVESQYHVVSGRGHLLTFIDPDARRQAIDFLRKHSSEEIP